jgi:hypothetical protein
MLMEQNDILVLLGELGERLGECKSVEIVLVGGAAGMLTGQLQKTRVTTDCDVIRYLPEEAQQSVLTAACELAKEKGLPENWLNSQVMTLDVLPEGWHGRRVEVGAYGSLHVSAIGRLDLLATKFYAAHPRDVEDITDMAPTKEELEFVGTYLNMLRVPSRQANLDQVIRAMNLLEGFREPCDG